MFYIKCLNLPLGPFATDVAVSRLEGRLSISGEFVFAWAVTYRVTLRLIINAICMKLIVCYATYICLTYHHIISF